ncbi:hypothetical protein [Actinoplanes xinjiangensis]|uniref:hypothetical protein n=1 Tax=Actinoplanes xinjiangensis TaxID=512350 RepID=UPI003447E64B
MLRVHSTRELRGQVYGRAEFQLQQLRRERARVRHDGAGYGRRFGRVQKNGVARICHLAQHRHVAPALDVVSRVAARSCDGRGEQLPIGCTRRQAYRILADGLTSTRGGLQRQPPHAYLGVEVAVAGSSADSTGEGMTVTVGRPGDVAYLMARC